MQLFEVAMRFEEMSKDLMLTLLMEACDNFYRACLLKVCNTLQPSSLQPVIVACTGRCARDIPNLTAMQLVYHHSI